MPVAQAFSTRVAGLKRSAGSASSAKAAGKALFLEAAEIADIDRIDVGKADAGMLDRLAGGAGDQRLEIVVLELAEAGMGEADDRGHD